MTLCWVLAFSLSANAVLIFALAVVRSPGGHDPFDDEDDEWPIPMGRDSGRRGGQDT